MLRVLWDILKSLPEVSNLRAQLSVAKERIVELEAEVAHLKDQLRDAALREGQQQNKIKGFEETVDELKHNKYSLKEPQIEMLKLIGNRGGRVMGRSELHSKLKLHVEEVEYHIQRLVDIGYLSPLRGSLPPIYELTQSGREFMIDKQLFR